MPLRLTFVLTLALAGTGRPGSDLERARILLDSMNRFVPRESVEKLLVVTRPADFEAVRTFLLAYERQIEITVRDETEVCPGLATNPDTTNNWPRPNMGWMRQQLIKLAAHRFVRTPFYMTLDADVLFTKPFDIASLIVDGRSKINIETIEHYRRIYQSEVAEHEAKTKSQRYRIAESLLNLQRDPGRLEFWHGETPVILSTEIVRNLTHHIEQAFDLPWERALLRDRTWTEYTLYFVYAEATGAIDAYHFSGGCDSVLNHSLSLWWPPEGYRDGRTIETWSVASVFDPHGPGYAVVVQSYLGIDPHDVREKVMPYIF